MRNLRLKSTSRRLSQPLSAGWFSAYGTKRTLACVATKLAFDPKRKCESVASLSVEIARDISPASAAFFATTACRHATCDGQHLDPEHRRIPTAFPEAASFLVSFTAAIYCDPCTARDRLRIICVYSLGAVDKECLCESGFRSV